MLLPLFLAYALALSIALGLAGFRAAAPSREVKPGAVGAAGSPPRPRPSRLLVVGATGGTGRQLVAQALERGYEVTALARTPSKLEIEHPRLTVLQGDVLDPASVDAAMAGQEAVVSALGHRRYFVPSRILSEGTRHLLQAMKAHGVPRLVCQTSLGVGDSAGRLGLPYTFFLLPLILPFYFWDKTRQERIVAASGAEWVIVRPGVLTDGPRRGQVRAGRKVGNFLWPARISRADAAAFLLDQLESDTWLRAAPGLAG